MGDDSADRRRKIVRDWLLIAAILTLVACCGADIAILFGLPIMHP